MSILITNEKLLDEVIKNNIDNEKISVLKEIKELLKSNKNYFTTKDDELNIYDAYMNYDIDIYDDYNQAYVL